MLIAPAMAVPSKFYAPLVAAFDEHGWHARALTRRGFEPDAPKASREHDWSFADEIADTQAAVDAARADRPESPVVLLGHSLGGQLSGGVQVGPRPADGLVLVGSSLPHMVHYRKTGIGLGVMAATIPIVTRVLGHVPKPWFGAPGARTLMSEWGRMVWDGTPPYEIEQRAQKPTLAVHLAGDSFSVPAAARRFERMIVEPHALTRWRYTRGLTPPGGSTHHVFWVRHPDRVVKQIVDWWSDQANASGGGQEHTKLRSP